MAVTAILSDSQCSTSAIEPFDSGTANMASGSSSTTEDSGNTHPTITPQTTLGSQNGTDSVADLNPKPSVEALQQEEHVGSKPKPAATEGHGPGTESPKENTPQEKPEDQASNPDDGPNGGIGELEGELPDDTEDPYWLKENTVDDIRGYGIRTLQERKREAPNRVLQLVQYVKLMEDRMSFLETEIEKINNKKAADPLDGMPDFGDPYGASSFPMAPGYSPMNLNLSPLKVGWESFSKQSAADATHVLVVLNENPATAGLHHLNRFSEGTPKHLAEMSSSNQIERIRINSPHILELFASWMSADLGPTPTYCVMIRPFKVLLAYEKKLREEYDALLEKVKVSTPVPDTENSQNDQPPASDLQVNDSSEDPSVEQIEEKGEATSEYERAETMEKLQHIQCLVAFLDEDIARELATHRELRSGVATKVSFKDLWHLYVPGDIAIANDQRQAYRILNVRGGRPSLGKNTVKAAADGGPPEVVSTTRVVSPFTIDCFYIDFNGKEFGPVQETFEIQSYDGEQEITKLELFPVKCLQDKGQARLAEFQKRGEKFKELADVTKVAHVLYKGKSLVDKHGERSTREQIDSQVIIDFENTFLATTRIPELGLPAPLQSDEREVIDDAAGLCSCGRVGCTFNNSTSTSPNYDDRKFDSQARDDFLLREPHLQHLNQAWKLRDEHLILLPSAVYGYVLRNLKIYALDIDLIQPIEPGQANFEDLVLPPLHKRLVESLVRSHSIVPTRRHDLQRGKGQGIIILLHGVPGVGKTSTAECVAEYTKKPLFPITCGNIGVTPSEVQDRLEEMFYLAHKWNCVMLLDEADVFLQARDNEDMKRNAVVSVFLRALEYYSGILFLTTNKVGKFDEAFKSRIHISLYYPSLGHKATRQIWNVNLKNIQKFSPNVVFDETEILDYATEHFNDRKDNDLVPWDGRQIRNAFQTALALAEFDVKDKDGKPVTLTKEHFQKVADASEAFDEYLEETRGADDVDLAQQKLERRNDKLSKSQMSNNRRSAGRSKQFERRSNRAPVGFDNSSMGGPMRRNASPGVYETPPARRNASRHEEDDGYGRRSPVSQPRAYRQDDERDGEERPPRQQKSNRWDDDMDDGEDPYSRRRNQR